MALKQVFNKSKLLLSSPVKSLGKQVTPLRPPHPCLVQPAASEMTQAPPISPLGPRHLGPCPAPKLRCPPPPCACPEPQKVSLGMRLVHALWFLAKLGLFVGVAQFTVDEGLWGTSEQTEDLARRMGILVDEQTDKKEDTTEPESRGWWNSAVVQVGQYFGLQP